MRFHHFRLYILFLVYFSRNDPELRDKILKNPELSFIGLDPKAILAKHQNDFSQVRKERKGKGRTNKKT